MSSGVPFNATDRIRAVEADVDTRLTDLWTAIWNGSHLDTAMRADAELAQQVASAIRVAYTQGYLDALREDSAGRRAELHRAHGYRPI